MNTVRSVGYGWGVLIAAGGGAYYFAKKSINEDRASKAERERLRREQQRALEASEFPNRDVITQQQLNAGASASDLPAAESGDPSREASQDPAPTRHAPADDRQRVLEKSKYEASEPFRSRKGDRFS